MSTSYPLQDGDIVFIATRGLLSRLLGRGTGPKTSRAGVVFRDAQHGWTVAEGDAPHARISLLDRFVALSDERWFVVRRLARALTPEELRKLRAACDGRIHAAAFAQEVYRKALGIDLGATETVTELLHRNPQEQLRFRKWWFFGRGRGTIAPASQPQSAVLHTVMRSAAPSANNRGRLAA